MNRFNWLVRFPKPGDLPELAAIATAVSQPASHVTRTALAQSNGRFWTITQQEKPIGYATLLPLPGLPGLFELSGGIAPQFQRQGAGSFLWEFIRQKAAGTAVQQITCTLNSLNSPTARFLQRHRFTLEHEEWTMTLENLAALPQVPPASGMISLQNTSQQTAVRTLPALYERSFRHTPWFQPYTPAEVAVTWEPDDQLLYLVENGHTIGFVWLHFPESGMAEIEPIGIVQEKQGMGYGRFLLTTLLNRLQNQGILAVTLGVWANNQPAIQLYRSVGFRYAESSYSFVYTMPPT